jgi:chromosomal replication initiation ATPase DnaA
MSTTGAVVQVEKVNAVLPHLCDRCRGVIECELTVTPAENASATKNTVEAMLQRFVSDLGVTLAEFRGHSKELMPARRQFCVMARKRGFTLLLIGKAIGRTHSTTLRMCRA